MNQTVDLRDAFSSRLPLGQREVFLRLALGAFDCPPIDPWRATTHADYEDRRRAYSVVSACVQEFEQRLLGTLLENAHHNTDRLVDAMDGRWDEAANIVGWLENHADTSGVWGP